MTQQQSIGNRQGRDPAAGQSPVLTNRATVDRRQRTAPRAAPPNVARFRIAAEQSDPLHFFIVAQWGLMAPFLLGVLLLLAAISRSLPDALSDVMLLAAMAICLAAPILGRFEQGLDRHGWERYPLMAFAVALPMMLFGLAEARWVGSRGLGWDLAVACNAVIVLVATALLANRLTAIIFASMALWLGASIHSGSLATTAMLGLGSAIGVYVALRQARGAAAEADVRETTERRQRRGHELLSEYEQNGLGWFWETDRRGQVTYVSPHIARLLGGSPEEIEGRAFTSLFMLEAHERESERSLVFHLTTRSSFQELPVRAATGEAEQRWWSITGRPVMDQFNNFMGFRGSGTDLTETRKSQQHVTQLARFDSLTKLANRFQMSEWLEKILAAPRVENRACAVFLLDLDRFKQVNDTMGHPAGDALLKQVAERLTSTVGAMGRVGRLGGDEFQVILPGHHQREGLGQLARRIIENLSQPYSLDGARVTIGASVGISICPDDGTTSEALIRNADLALYAAKGGGRGRHHFYDEDLHSDAKERQQLEQDMRDAISSGGFELHYQPQVRTTTETITGFEALIRWKHPVHGYLSPAKFVPIAEEAGLVAQMGEWALRTACRDLATWPESVRVAVNVSPLQFANPALPAIVTNAIASAGVNPARLELEITESVFLGDDRNTEAMFAALKGVGVRLALDDFGTGYSSLGYLKKAPFDKIKIDQSFVRGATIPESRNGAIISSIVSLAEALGMETTAEGVETLDELDLVRVLGCSHIQGYIYARPLSAEAALERLAQGLQAVANGPRSARAPRQTMLRKVVLEHSGHVYEGTIRNISQTGAMIEGLWNVPVGTPFAVHLAEDYRVEAESRWCKEDRMGVQFARPLELDATGAVQFTPPRARRDRSDGPLLRRAG
ncbi:EAL domain-containing protein [Novosphingobium colocasiae]|uniref:EAL domain-containing protein n=1 Tax=Novosphingobium colocasiae TaxID=1256513 RepID=A0A918UII3_9SPHN|nr:EAL domain-containing protein [Novosphingobium colocasiae]GGZ12892.1 hypothetical protein GCM10011614_29970 [Novosphingobium colocasiae]